jgi:hypothetical protein
MKISTVLALAAGFVAGIAAPTGASAQASAPLGYPQMQDTVPPMAKYGKAYTPGWDLMTKDERKQLGAKVRKLQRRDECQALMAQVRQQMSDRAQSRGLPPPAQPKRDACDELPN